MQTAVNAMYEALTGALTAVIGWIGTVLDSFLTGDLNALLPIFAIGVVISLVMLTVKLLRSFTWGG